MRKHPGIWFTLWSMVTIFLLSFELAVLGVNRELAGWIMLGWSGECMIWMMHFHTQWLMKLDKKFNKLERRTK